jgi:uncharacterized membrane protein YuzA (DUF378 family)
LLVLPAGSRFVGALVVGALGMVPVHLKASMFGGLMLGRICTCFLVCGLEFFGVAL